MRAPVEWTDFAIADLADSEVEDVKLRRHYRQTDPNRLKLIGAIRSLQVDNGCSVGPLTGGKRLFESVRNFVFTISKKHKIKIVTRKSPGQNGYVYLQVVRIA